jgi:integrase
LLNRVADTFFGYTQWAMYTDVVLTLCRYTDPAESSNKVGQRPNLTLERLVNAVTADDATSGDRLVAGEWDAVKKWRAAQFEEIRSKRIAHNDLAKRVARFNGQPIDWPSREQVAGQRKSKSAGTADPEKAETARGDLEYELNHGKHQEVSRMTWERFRELFTAEYVAHRKQATRLVYENVFNLFERICNPRTLRSITERTISTFAAGLRKTAGNSSDGMQPGTIKARLQFLRTAIRWAAKQKMIRECPDFPTIKVPKKKPQPVAVEAFERQALKAPDDHLQAFLLCGWLGGLQLQEAVCLEWEENDKAPWINFNRARIVFPAEFVKAAEDQWVPLDPVLKAALEALPRHGRRVFRFEARDGHLITLPSISQRVIVLARNAGVRLSMHSLRKGFGCRYAGKVPAQVLQKLMRDSNIKITMDYYANVDAAVEEAVFGPQCNTSRNKPENETGSGIDGIDARASEETIRSDSPETL